MLRGGKEEKTTEEIEAQLILEEVLREGRGERDEIGEREEWNEHVGWHRKEDIHLRHQKKEIKTTTKKELLDEKEDDKPLQSKNAYNKEHHITGIHERINYDYGTPERKIGRSIRGHSAINHDDQYYHHKNNVTSSNIPKTVGQLLIAALVLAGIFISWIVRKTTTSKWRKHRRVMKGRTL